MTGSQRRAELYREQNLEAARIIAMDPQKYPGVMQEWAAMVLNPPAKRTAPATRRATAA